MRLVTAAAVAAMLLTTAAPAMAKGLPDGGVTAKDIADVLKAEGFKAEVGKDDEGDPMITSGAEGKTFQVFFYGCDGDRCAVYQFSAGFDINTSPGLAKTNKWNRERRLARVFLDEEDDPILQMDVDAEKGHSTEAIANNLASWVTMLGMFKKEFGI